MPLFRTLNHSFFKKWSPEMAYVLGFFAADGNMIKNNRGAHFIGFYSNDRELLASIRTILKSDHKIGIKRQVPPSCNSYQIQIGSKEIFNDLISLGLSPNKSRTLRFPKVPRIFFNDFLRGYFDGDGNVYFGKHFAKDRQKYRWVFQTRFTSGSLLFLYTLHNLLKKHGIKGGSLIKKKHGFDLLFSHNDSLVLFNLLYYNNPHGAYLKRKRKIFERAISRLYGGVAQPGGAIPCHGRGCGFKSRRSRYRL